MEISRLNRHLRAGFPALSVVERVLKNLGDIEAAVLASEVALSGNFDLLTAEHRIIVCILRSYAVSDECGRHDRIRHDRGIGHTGRPH